MKCKEAKKYCDCGWKELLEVRIGQPIRMASLLNGQPSQRYNQEMEWGVWLGQWPWDPIWLTQMANFAEPESFSAAQ